MNKVEVYSQVPLGLKIVNISRLLQFLFKLVVYILMIVAASNQIYKFGYTLVALIIFIGYHIWRFFHLFKRIGRFVLQWPLPLCASNCDLSEGHLHKHL